MSISSEDWYQIVSLLKTNPSFQQKIYNFLLKVYSPKENKKVAFMIPILLNGENIISILLNLRNYYSNNPPLNSEGKGRVSARMDDIKPYLKQYQNQNLCYLDVGSSEGDISLGIIEELKLPYGCGYGVDIVAQQPRP